MFLYIAALNGKFPARMENIINKHDGKRNMAEEKGQCTVLKMKDGKNLLTFSLDVAKIKHMPAALVISEVQFKGNKIDFASIRHNVAFIQFIMNYENEIQVNNPTLIKAAKTIKNGKLPVFDRKAYTKKKPEAHDLIGFFLIKDGKPVKYGFQYNIKHKVVAPDGKLSDLFTEEPLNTIVQDIAYGRKQWKQLLEPIKLGAKKL
jgi:hypothetical protein